VNGVSNLTATSPKLLAAAAGGYVRASAMDSSHTK
jgi:hypothetical protein